MFVLSHLILQGAFLAGCSLFSLQKHLFVVQ
nr:MAG TPA: hypothetical protein [Caudoviricetes sp.]